MVLTFLPPILRTARRIGPCPIKLPSHFPSFRPPRSLCVLAVQMLLAYPKNELENLTSSQLKILKSIIETEFP